MVTIIAIVSPIALVTALDTPDVDAAPRTVTVRMTDHGFVPSYVMAIMNQPIRIVVLNTGSKVHQFSLPYYRIYTQDLSPGASSTVGFSPWTVGQFAMISDPSGANRAEFSGSFHVIDGD